MRPPRGLSPEEAALWARLAATVAPLEGRRHSAQTGQAGQPAAVRGAGPEERTIAVFRPPAGNPPPLPRGGSSSRIGEGSHGLDSSWNRRLARGSVEPDFTLDLHGCTLDAAHSRLDHGLTQALAQGARVILLITGRTRPSNEHGGRGERRGAIRAKFLDWLAAGPHAGRIAAVRPAHPRHGGAGAVYIVLRRPR